ncbi:MAG TPA: glycosyltransferase [Methylomirabilota bacterium]|nr:glycosyltransferase [Methylomirabilota bacterium]
MASTGGVRSAAWPVVHRAIDDQAASPQHGARLEIHWSGGRAVAGFAIDEDGRRRPHPATPPDLDLRPVDRLPVEPVDAGRLTVVIPTRDRPDDLSRCLASLAAQSLPPDQVVVVDNGSATPAAGEAAVAAGATLVREERPGLDYARNAGTAAARGDIIAFCDDDVALHPDWCREILRAFGDPAVSAVTGLVLPMELETEAQRTFEFEWGFGRGFEPIEFGPDFFRRTMSGGCPAWLIGAGASMAFRREVFESVGLFDERLDAGRAGCSGDSEFWYRILATGGVCRYEPRIVSFHRHRKTMDELNRQVRAYMRGHVAALLVQHQRFGHHGNLRRAVLTLPVRYAGRIARKAARGGDGLLWSEIFGFASGFVYFLRHRR